MRRFFSALFMLALLAVVVFNAWQVSVTRREVADLKAQVAALKSHGSGGSSEATPIALVNRARKHAALAKEYMLKGDLKRAKVELDDSLQLMQRAGQDTGTSYKEKIEKAQKTLEDTRSAVERLLKKFEKQPEKSKGG
ncbi:MAG TPA: hypothetical protein VFI02_07645 [Armatimonadota bacterium]|nr:hypothetical protein [Armatimonadota bacterium]